VIERPDQQPCLNPRVRLPGTKRRAVFMVGLGGRFRKLSRLFLLLVKIRSQPRSTPD
jgi:hypothetical protein